MKTRQQDKLSSRFVPMIESIATGNPQHITQQGEAAKFVAQLHSYQRHQDRIEKIYKNTRIETRHLAVDLLTEETVAFSQERNTLEKRMQMFAEAAVPLAEEVAKKALLKASLNSNQKIEDSIGLIVFVTSTGFVAPGIDAKLIKNLGLRRNIARIPVNFMGCAAAMNGLRVACDYVIANPIQKALVICLELSSINAVFDDNLNDIIIHSIFGDGCAAVVLGAAQEETLINQGKFIIRDKFSYLAEDTEDGITLGVRDNGVTCLLSPQLPDYIQGSVGLIINNFLASHQLTTENIDLWAVHPGGTRILERAQLSLGLTDEQLTDSWEILRQYGNMLSCAVLFVMERMLLRNETSQDKLTGIAFSFSPGVGIEGLLFEKI
jgi:alpha-pyrone synthase